MFHYCLNRDTHNQNKPDFDLSLIIVAFWKPDYFTRINIYLFYWFILSQVCMQDKICVLLLMENIASCYFLF